MPDETPEDLRIAERNAFYESLSIEARDRFLRALEDAKARGLDDEASWREAVIAAETTYPPEGADAPIVDMPPPPGNEKLTLGDPDEANL